MKLAFHPAGWADYLYWQNTDRQVAKRINRLINDVLRDPFTGIGKPEHLKHMAPGAWSRRITDEHRLVYQVKDSEVIILQARYHY
ncbi:Txe/YoeB family addiction module toxin [Streptomyces gobiensis]|uniref:Txe/YoeB family addiction module toxin n=1 Tax=Streptomyces gobiensis TaxID=2875706 RepID=UPI001E58A448|nr:Txe/YoeB family addiction module toxin [Streptomyces gobiensis]UGY91118.1 Txe/YoeB family addiction module toxin [Streptomyces gobiensis]